MKGKAGNLNQEREGIKGIKGGANWSYNYKVEENYQESVEPLHKMVAVTVCRHLTGRLPSSMDDISRKMLMRRPGRRGGGHKEESWSAVGTRAQGKQRQP